MKKKIFASMALLALLMACNDDYDNQFHLDSSITDVKDIALTLATSDYGTISKLAANQELALSKDPEGKTFLTALEAVGTDHYFTENAPAEDYLPAYLKSKYPNADEGSKFAVTYNLYQEPSAYLADFANISTYELSDNDYKTVWGESVKASFLSPSTLAKIPALLKDNVSGAAAGDMKVVNYAYSQLEPSTGGSSSEEPVITKIADALANGAGDYNVQGEIVALHSRGFLVSDGTGVIMTYLNATPNYSVGDVVMVSGTTSSYNGAPFQFSKEAVITVIERNKTFAYPTPKQMDGAAMDQYLTIQPVEYVTYKGKLIIDGSYYNVEVEGAATAMGSISYPVAGLIDPALNGKDVIVTGYAVGKSGAKYVTTMATSVVAADGSSAAITPIGVVALSAGGDYTVRGVVAATYARGFLLTDGSGSILVYKTTECAVGDVMTVSGTTSTYSGFMQFPGAAIVTPGEKGSFKAPAAQVMSAADLDAYLTAPRLAYVAYEGKLIISGNYYNVEIEGATTAQGSISYPVDGLIDKSLDGKKVIVTGYAIGVSSSKFVNTMATSVVEATAATANTVRAFAAARAASPAPNAAALYIYDGSTSTWKEYTTNDAKVTVVDPSVYESLGAQFIEDPETVLPIYLKQQYPYASPEQKVAVVYNKKADEPTVVEYTMGESWSETTSSAPTTLTFTMSSEGIQSQSDVYLDASFAKGEDGFTFQDIFLDGVSYVWKLDPYGYWKASAFANKVNNPAESWLVSPVVNLKKATAPEMTFDHVSRFLNENPVENFLSVKVSTDYKGDVKAATWTTLTVPVWQDGKDWTFINCGKIDMSDYVGKEVYIAFQYISTSEVGPTWEIKNLVIREPAEEEPAE